MSVHVTYASGDSLILEKAFHLLQGTELWMPSIDTESESTTWWDRFFHMIHAVGALLCRGTYGRYYHASGEWRAVIWRAVSDEKPIIVKNISYFRNYF